MMKADKSSPYVPNLRFPEFRDAGEWEERKVGEVFEVTRGKVLAMPLVKDERTDDAPYPVYSSQTKNVGLAGYFSEYLYEDAITWTTDGANAGDVNYRPGKFYCTNVCGVLISDKGFANLCTASLINSVSRQHVSYVGNPKLMNGVMAKIRVAFPSLLEQQKIADCVGSLDDMIAAEGRKLEALRQHKQGLMQQLFPQPGETVPRLRFPEFQDAPDWKTGRCRDIARVLPGFGFPDKFQGNKMGQYPFYKVSDISRAIERGQRYISEANNYIDPDVLDEIRGKPVPAGTIIFAKIGEAIRSNRRVVTTKPAVIDNNTAGVKAIKTKSSDEFLFYLWSNVSLIDHAGGVVPAVSKSELENVPLSYPSDPEEQQRIADCLSALDTRIGAQLAKLNTLRTHKQGLLQQLFPSLEGDE